MHRARVDVTVIDCFTDDYSRAIKHANIEQVSGEQRFRLVEADLSVDPIDPLLDCVDVVFHLATQPGVRASGGPRSTPTPAPTS